MRAPMRNVFLIVNKIITKQSAIVKILQCVKQQTVPGLCGVPWGPKLVGAMFLYNAISKSSIFQKKKLKDRSVIGTNSGRQARNQDFRLEAYLLCNDGFHKRRSGGGDPTRRKPAGRFLKSFGKKKPHSIFTYIWKIF